MQRESVAFKSPTAEQPRHPAKPSSPQQRPPPTRFSPLALAKAFLVSKSFQFLMRFTFRLFHFTNKELQFFCFAPLFHFWLPRVGSLSDAEALLRRVEQQGGSCCQGRRH